MSASRVGAADYRNVDPRAVLAIEISDLSTSRLGDDPRALTRHRRMMEEELDLGCAHDRDDAAQRRKREHWRDVRLNHEQLRLADPRESPEVAVAETLSAPIHPKLTYLSGMKTRASPRRIC